MKSLTESLTQRTGDYHSKFGLMVEKEFLIFNKPIVSSTTNIWQPSIDIYETSENVVVKMDISGVDIKEMNIEFDGSMLTISGERSDESGHLKTCYHQMEIRYGHFERKISIPKPIKEENIEAMLEDGILMIVFPIDAQFKACLPKPVFHISF